MNPAEDGAKRTVRGRLVKVLVHTRDDRGMVLEPFASRCVRHGEIHELVTTDQRAAGLGERIDRVGFLGFVEISRAGVLDRGDVVEVGGRPIGTVLGFDACHFPNHLNVLIATAEPLTGPRLGLQPEDEISFESPSPLRGGGGPSGPEGGMTRTSRPSQPTLRREGGGASIRRRNRLG
jgi:hypothetical protein